MDPFCYLWFVFVSHNVLSVHCNLGKRLTSWLFVCDVFLCFCHFPIWCPRSLMVFDCINSFFLTLILL